CTEAEALGRPLLTLAREQDRDEHAAMLARVRAEVAGPTAGGAMQGIGLRRNGEEFPAELSVASWPRGRGSALALIVRDVSERRLAEVARRASEGGYRMVVSAMAEGILLIALDGTIAACNESAERILGRSAGQIV